jgi:hypothetical protein
VSVEILESFPSLSAIVSKVLGEEEQKTVEAFREALGNSHAMLPGSEMRCRALATVASFSRRVASAAARSRPAVVRE